jgi:chromosome segregation and condensation protein ScpB
MPSTGDGDKKRDRGLLEAALFLAGKPLSRRKLAKILDEASLAYVDLLPCSLTNYARSFRNPIAGSSFA